MVEEKPKPHKVQRSVRGGKFANTFNVFGYRVAGQVFSRMLFPLIDIKEYLLPVDPPTVKSPIINKPYPHFFERSNLQPDVADYYLQDVKVYLFLGKQAKLLEKTKTDANGEFRFSTVLRFGRKYQVIAHADFVKKGFTPIQEEVVETTFCIQRSDIRRGKSKKGEKPNYAEMMNVVECQMHVRHLIRYLGFDDVFPKEKGKRTFSSFDKYKMKAPFYWSGGARGRLWLGGKASVLFNTFVLNVPYVNQKNDAPKKDYLEIDYKGETWSIPVDTAYTCITACITMVLRYFGLNVSMQRVMEKASWEYLELTSAEPRHGLSEQNYKDGILQLSDKKGTYPYCLELCMMKAAERLLKESGVQASELIIKASKLNPLQDNEEYSALANSVAMLGVGLPLIMIEGTEEYAQFIAQLLGRDVEILRHAKVLRGIVITSKNAPFAFYFNDPNLPVDTFDRSFSASCSGHIILGRKLKQSEISNDQKRLMYGGNTPARRLLQPNT